MVEFFVYVVVRFGNEERTFMSAKVKAKKLPRQKEELEIDFRNRNTIFMGGKMARKTVAGKRYRVKVTEVNEPREAWLPWEVICLIPFEPFSAALP